MLLYYNRRFPIYDQCNKNTLFLQTLAIQYLGQNVFLQIITSMIGLSLLQVVCNLIFEDGPG